MVDSVRHGRFVAFRICNVGNRWISRVHKFAPCSASVVALRGGIKDLSRRDQRRVLAVVRRIHACFLAPGLVDSITLSRCLSSSAPPRCFTPSARTASLTLVRNLGCRPLHSHELYSSSNSLRAARGSEDLLDLHDCHEVVIDTVGVLL
jgi:hypothetical protein